MDAEKPDGNASDDASLDDAVEFAWLIFERIDQQVARRIAPIDAEIVELRRRLDQIEEEAL
jgi:hypothetical protein